MAGPYCHGCGQKKIDRHDFALKHFFGHVLHEFTHLDANKIVKTLLALLFRPGLLTEQYLAGRKGAYVDPIRVYLTVSALFFLFAWGVLSHNRGGSAASMTSRRAFIALAQQKGVEPHALAEKITQKQEKYAAGLRFGGVLLSGVFLTLLFYGTKRYYVEHLIFSLHFYSFDFFLRCGIALVLLGFATAGLNAFSVATLIFYPLAFTYLFIGLRQVYKESKARTFLKASALLAGETALFYGVVYVAYMLSFRFA